MGVVYLTTARAYYLLLHCALMKEELTPDALEAVKRRLQSYVVEEVSYAEPHFTEQLVARGGNREAATRHLLEPNALVYAYREPGKYGDWKYVLYFRLDSTRTLLLPVIFDSDGRKNIYILTYMLRYRSWQSMKL